MYEETILEVYVLSISNVRYLPRYSMFCCQSVELQLHAPAYLPYVSTVTTLFEHAHITSSITPSIALETKLSYTRATIDLSDLSIPCDTTYYLYFHLILVPLRRDKVTSNFPRLPHGQRL